MAISITSLTLSKSACQYNPDNTVKKYHHTVVVAGVNLAYCDTEEEAKAVLAAVNNLRSTDGIVP